MQYLNLKTKSSISYIKKILKTHNPTFTFGLLILLNNDKNIIPEDKIIEGSLLSL